jgi:endonuclease/exonuclease/phosphatase (EEP) superfamily protein YafD
MKVIQYVVLCLAYLTLLFSFLPLLRSQQWFVRMFDYPRAQKFVLNLILIITVLLLFDISESHPKVLLSLLIINQFYLLRQIWSYLPIAAKQMKRNRKQGGSSIKLLIANVYQDNRDVKRCKDMIQRCNPDVFLLVEVDKYWADELTSFKKDYPFQIIQDQPNTYGMLLYSRFKIIQNEVRFLIEKDIPSFKVDFETNEGNIFRLYSLHPKPPVPTEAETSEERDAEILLIGKEAKKCTMPVIVAGDLNDVAWSYSTRLFLKVSGLLDPRRGRGFYNTFNAHYFFFRWPLDHVFCSSHFLLNRIKRLPSIGSDHFPISIEISLMPQPVKENKEEQKHADSAETKLANDMIATAK